MQTSELRAEAASILEAIYEERGDWLKLIGAAEILSASEGDVAKRVQLQRKIARVSAEQVKDYGRAFAALAAALRLRRRQLICLVIQKSTLDERSCLIPGSG